MAKRVFTFRRGAAERTPDAAESLGQKGANLALLAALDLPVPPGFTVSTAAWRDAMHGGISQSLRSEIRSAVEWLQQATGRSFDGNERPLLLAVRTSSHSAMPGLADTILDVGLNDRTVATFAGELGDPTFAYRSYRRFIEGFAILVFGADDGAFEELYDAERERAGWSGNEPETLAGWRDLIARQQAYIERDLGETLPQNPFEQLLAVCEASFASWRGPVARAFRILHGIPENAGLAVTAHAMIFNERGEKSGTGRALSRDLATGLAKLTGEFSIGGRDLTREIGERGVLVDLADDTAARFPGDLAALADHVRRIEAHLGDACEVDFMVGDGELVLLQSRRARRSAAEAIRVVVELVREGLVEEEEGLLRIDPTSLDQLLHPTIERGEGEHLDIIARGLPASPGAAQGELVFTAERAMELSQEGRPTILARVETLPDDVHGMHVTEGVLTIRGGTTSHAAVVARGIGKPCVTGAGTLRINAEAGTLSAAGRVWHAGDLVTIDGTSGEIISGAPRLRRPTLTGDFATLMGFADRARRMGVRTNAETPIEARAARAFGAEGIGLCRTEHMFFEGERIGAMREMILAADEAGRRAALARLLPMQRSDFVELFEIMAGLPVTIRLLDPPLHEFLPKGETEIAETAAALGLSAQAVRERLETLQEFNPMLGHRGCRLAISYPEIVETQARAIFEAAIEAGERKGKDVVPEIMVPLVGMRKELDFVKARIDEIAELVAAERGRGVNYLVGTMIELPRAIIRADTIAEVADFFSFGTNDLTQTVYGISRDDSANFLSTYQRLGIIDRDPFQFLDVDGVGELIAYGVEKARRTRPDISIGVCGEQGGDPDSIGFFEKVGLDYVSCSPYRVPIARLAAAQSAIRLGRAQRGTGTTKSRIRR